MQPPNQGGRLFHFMQRLADLLGAMLFITLFLVFLVQVGARFFFDSPLPWTDELSVVLYVWVVLWAAAFMVKPRDHISFDLLGGAGSVRLQNLRDRTGLTLTAGLAAWAIPSSYDYMRFMAREGTPVLGIPLMWVFLPFVLLMLSLFVKSLWALAASFRRST